MPPLTRRHLVITAGLVALVLAAVGVVRLALVPDLRSRAEMISIGMPREQVEELLGRPVLVLQRTGGRGTALAWVDQLWQLDVLTGPDGRVERIGCVPSDSMLRRTMKGLKSLLR